jgi:LPS-assembly lipoprotein
MRRLGLVAPLAFALAGCIQPLYGTLGPGGLESELQAIRVEPIPDRFGHYVEKELAFAFNGTGLEVPPKYRLVVTLKQKVQAPVVDTVTSRATAATVVGDASFELYALGKAEPLMRGVQRRRLRPFQSAHFQCACGARRGSQGRQGDRRTNPDADSRTYGLS